ncbi:MAG TPA: CHAT domain-containing protein, partial [Blastocatellia bacterium]|nr:CHAT domain-containing protein [Blastocatellia bacterium]
PAVQIWEGLPDGPIGQGVVFGYLGAAQYALGDWEKVIDSYEKELFIHKEMGSAFGEAISLGKLASFHLRLGNTEKALEYANLTLEVVPRTKDRLREANALNTLGSIYRTTGELNKAAEAYDRALALRPLADRRTEGTLLCNRGSVSFEMGQMQAGLDYLNQSLVTLRAAGERRVEGIALRCIGEIYSSLGEQDKALSNFNLALGITRATGDLAEQAKTLYCIARTKRDLNQPREARVDIESAIGIVESLRLRIADQQLRSFYSPIVTGYYDLYIDILMRQPEESSENLNSRAIEASERGRARSLLELLAESRIEIRRGVDGALLKRERSVQQSLNTSAEEQIRLVSGKHSPEQAQRVAGRIKSLTSALDEVRAQIRAANPRYATLTQPEPLTLKQIQGEVLDADTLLLEYALGDKRSYVWSVTRNSIKGFELPGRAVIEAAARRFYDSLRQKTDDQELAKSAARLSEILLGPVAEQLGTRRLAIVADGALQYVPFAALPVPSAKGSSHSGIQPGRSGPDMPPANAQRPLILDHEIVNLPSASALGVLRRETKNRPRAPKLVAVIADPVFDQTDVRVRRGAITEPSNSSTAEPNNAGLKRSVEETGLGGGFWPLPRLLGTRREAKAILSLAPAQVSRQAVDFDASHETAIGEDLSQYQIVHFATHGLINNRHPELSGLVLSLVDKQGQPHNGFLRLNEIYNLRLPAELVVLSACQTGLGREIRGEGLVGLTRGFMYAGARRLMASLWQVDDAATGELMQRFYRGVLGEKRLSPSAALRAAQTEMWTQKQWRSPYYWASFVVQGEWNK